MGSLRYDMRIELAQGAQNNGLADMVASLILQNLNDKPQKRADFAKLRGRVAIVAEDARVSMTLAFTGNMLTVHDGIVGVPDVTVRATSDDIIQMSLVELTPRWALPDRRGAVMKQVQQRTDSGQIRVYGALLHPALMLRLTRLLSVN
ncbi:MAG TPA: SCP2 sterol-binding domain-containing protein [Polyangiales bacterium]